MFLSVLDGTFQNSLQRKQIFSHGDEIVWKHIHTKEKNSQANNKMMFRNETSELWPNFPFFVATTFLRFFVTARAAGIV